MLDEAIRDNKSEETIKATYDIYVKSMTVQSSTN